LKKALELAWSTPAAWAEEALREPLFLLSDHAHCEMGATVSAQGMIARYPDKPKLVERMGALAVEELRHFNQVHRLLVRLGGTLQPIRTNDYAEALLREIRGRNGSLLDRLLVSAVIERRSLERFELLAELASGSHPELARLYGELAPSEAGHAMLFVELAGLEHSAEELERSLRGWLELEARILRGLPPGPRIHSGPPVAAASPVEGDSANTFSAAGPSE